MRRSFIYNKTGESFTKKRHPTNKPKYNWHESDIMRQSSIFYLPSNNYNKLTDSQKHNYKSFLEYNKTFLGANKFSDENINVYAIDSANDEDTGIMSELEDKYKGIYTPQELNFNIFYYEDILKKRDVLEKELETEMGGIKRIRDQTDDEFRGTIQERIKQLDTCATNPNSIKTKKEYFEAESEKEKELTEENDYSLSNYCHNVTWGEKEATLKLGTDAEINNFLHLWTFKMPIFIYNF